MKRRVMRILFGIENGGDVVVDGEYGHSFLNIDPRLMVSTLYAFVAFQ